MKILAAILCAGVVWGMSGAASGAVIQLFLDGKAGLGLLPGNENHVVTNGGTGGILGGGIFVDDVANTITMDIAWGSGNGFTDLSGDATMAHIHGPTPSQAPAAYTEDAGVMIFISGQPGYDASATSGGFTGTLALTPVQTQSILEGRTYVNVHTGTNPGGEIRGHLVVPEPSAAALLGLVGMAFLARRRRRS